MKQLKKNNKYFSSKFFKTNNSYKCNNNYKEKNYKGSKYKIEWKYISKNKET